MKKQQIVDRDVWFNLDRVLSYNAILNFIVGYRGVGKTYGCKVWALNKFLKTKRKFIYLRRFKDELNGTDLSRFFTQIEDDEICKGHALQVKGREFYCDGFQCGQAIYLSVQQSKKSVDYSEYDTIIFDEFIIEKGYQHYLPNEVTKLFNFMDTVFRNRDGCRCLCLANSINWANPYFTFFKFLPMDSGYQVAQEGTVLLNIYENKKFLEMRKESKLAKMVRGTSYEEMAIENKFVDVNNDFLKPRPKQGILQFNIQWKQNTYGLWYDTENYCYVIAYAHNNDVITVCYTTNDYKPNMKVISDSRERKNADLKKAFRMGYLYFEDMFIRNEMYDLLNLLGLK